MARCRPGPLGPRRSVGGQRAGALTTPSSDRNECAEQRVEGVVRLGAGLFHRFKVQPAHQRAFQFRNDSASYPGCLDRVCRPCTPGTLGAPRRERRCGMAPPIARSRLSTLVTPRLLLPRSTWRSGTVAGRVRRSGPLLAGWHTRCVSAEVADELMELAGGDPFAEIRRESESRQRRHRCGLHNAGVHRCSSSRCSPASPTFRLGRGDNNWLTSCTAQRRPPSTAMSNPRPDRTGCSSRRAFTPRGCR